MKERPVLKWALVSLVLFLGINLIMSLPIAGVVERNGLSSELLASSAIVVVLYLVPFLAAALGFGPAYYVLGIVMVMYSVGLAGGIVTLWTQGTAGFFINGILTLASVFALLVNLYWLVLAIRLRNERRLKRDMDRYGHKEMR
ncbi:hypothetical protein [Levilactobacillus bambusae]|uniref:Integral membrane protein n=1 Tax=Levilactobacillus bambusae TaxID=2024736 RepID=A0A2V1MXW6_9LACO|nr:hypothetical protein [Levilactobacillus bambusae]PWF99838.1 hypothetical protein DCM90_07195 [Levilactobacillus bambusae]